MLTDKNFYEIEANAAYFYINKTFDLAQSKMQAAYDYGRRVKPLVWLEVDNEWCESEGEFGYWIDIQSAEDSVAPFTLYCGDDELGYFSSLDGAIAGCQAHHESIILGALA